MPLQNFGELFARLDARRPQVAVIAAGGADPTVLTALADAATRGWVQPAVVGRRQEIERVALECGVNISDFRLVESESPAVTAVAEIRAGRAVALMKGQIPTPDLMGAVLRRETGLRGGRTIGQLVLMEIRRDDRCFLLADTGIAIAPTLAQKSDLTRELIVLARILGRPAQDEDWKPRVAAMAASEKVQESMPETLDARALQEMGENGELGPGIVQGPLSFDLAYAAEAGTRKGISGQAIGFADAMIFPCLSSANLTVKAMMYTSDCCFGGCLCGTTHPVVFMSRADSVETRLHSLALTLEAWQSGFWTTT